jgi:hypothetical protein
MSEVERPSRDLKVSPVGRWRLESGHQVRGHPAAVLDLDALGPGPLADPGSVQAARGPSVAAAGWLAGAAADPAGSIDQHSGLYHATHNVS